MASIEICLVSSMIYFRTWHHVFDWKQSKLFDRHTICEIFEWMSVIYKTWKISRVCNEKYCVFERFFKCVEFGRKSVVLRLVRKMKILHGFQFDSIETLSDVGSNLKLHVNFCCRWFRLSLVPSLLRIMHHRHSRLCQNCVTTVSFAMLFFVLDLMSFMHIV